LQIDFDWREKFRGTVCTIWSTMAFKTRI